jgi:uncharacterized membrane protein
MVTLALRRLAAGFVVVLLLGTCGGCSDDPAGRDTDTDGGAETGDDADDADALAEVQEDGLMGDGAGDPDVAADGDAGDDTDTGPTGPCDAEEVAAEGACETVLGWAWDGEACRALRGCACTGVRCDELAEERVTCETEHVQCVLERRWELVLVPALEGHEHAAPLALNASGVLVGTSGPEPWSPVAEAVFVALPSTALVPLTVPEVSFGYARGVNAAGVIVGENQLQAQMWVGGERTPLPPPDGWFSSVARDISSDGLIVGTFADYDDALPPNPIGPRPCVWPDPSAPAVPLATLSEDDVLGYAVRVNAAGAIGGTVTSDGIFVPALWASSEAVPEALPLPEDALMAEGHALNGHGDVVGRAAFADHSQAYLYRREAGTTEALPFPAGVSGGFRYSEAWAITDGGVVAGTATAPGGGVRAVLWYGGEVADLTSAVAELPEGVRYLIAATAVDGEGRLAVEVALDGPAPDGPRAMGVLVPVTP